MHPGVGRQMHTRQVISTTGDVVEIKQMYLPAPIHPNWSRQFILIAQCMTTRMIIHVIQGDCNTCKDQNEGLGCRPLGGGKGEGGVGEEGGGGGVVGQGQTLGICTQ